MIAGLRHCEFSDIYVRDTGFTLGFCHEHLEAALCCSCRYPCRYLHSYPSSSVDFVIEYSHGKFSSPTDLFNLLFFSLMRWDVNNLTQLYLHVDITLDSMLKRLFVGLASLTNLDTVRTVIHSNATATRLFDQLVRHQNQRGLGRIALWPRLQTLVLNNTMREATVSAEVVGCLLNLTDG